MSDEAQATVGFADAKVRVPKGCGSFSFNGVEYTPDKKGFALVPPEAVAELASHGIVGVDDADAE